jgi:hypothetical protein
MDFQEHRQYKFKSTGKIIYDPHRPGLRKKKNWWCVVETDPDIVEYYRHQLEKELWIKTLPPSWGSHISIIRGERPPSSKYHLWKRYHNQEVEFEYTHTIHGNGEFWWINVHCPLFKQIREEFDFPSDWGQHLTIAKVHPNWPVRQDQWLDTI